jgi:hypothetical protein
MAVAADIPSDMKWLTVADLAAILGLKPQTVYNRLSACPETLPPVTRVPSLRGPRWSPRIVRDWQAMYDPPAFEPKHRPGRPTKIESVARRGFSER